MEHVPGLTLLCAHPWHRVMDAPPTPLRTGPQSLGTTPSLPVPFPAPPGSPPVPQDGMNWQGTSATVSAVRDAPVNVGIDFERAA